ncbi:MAG: tripartite tricarboxylate transporter substrate binding protein [Xanthobacteraceae bacterium]|nr:tripartite tricarboxylate transporter substrate binding protein [Xanthobacteraceae bacterium]
MSWKPERPIEIVAGTPPGGGLDRSARALGKAIEAGGLVDVPVRIVNVGGDGGRKAWVHMEKFAGDGHVIGISSPNMAADYLMGVTRSDPDRFAPLAILYSEYIAFVASTRSTLRNGVDLLARLAKSPRDISIALSTSLGNSNHVAVAKIARHAGADARALNIRVFDTALDAVADAVAGHADVSAITAASSVPEIEAGQLRTLAISSPARLPGVYAQAPTWKELGVDCVVGSWRGVSGPAGLDEEQISFWQGVLSKAVQAPEWKADLARLFWTPMYLDGAALLEYLKRERSEMHAVLRDLGLLSG